MRRYLYPALFVLLAALLILPRLGQRPLWGDEAETALTAETVLTKGIPMVASDHWLSSFWQLNANDSLVQVRQPWLPFYLVAGSMVLFGHTPWAARLPFALAAIATVPCIVLLARRLWKDEWTAVFAGVLCCTSVSFLLYARQSRYYALVMLLTVLLCWAYLNLSAARKSSIAWFAILWTLLFYSSHLAWVTLLLSMAACVLLFDRSRDKLMGFSIASAAASLLALPWLIYAGIGAATAMPGKGDRVLNILKLVVMYFRDYGDIGLFPALLLPVLLAAIVMDRDRRRTVLLLLVISVGITLTTSIVSPETKVLTFDDKASIRFVVGVIPLFILLTAACCGWMIRWGRGVAIAAVVVLAGSNLLWIPWNALQHDFNPSLFSRWSPMANYFYEITHDVDDPVAVAARFLKEHGAIDRQQAVALPPYLSDSLTFQTGLRFSQPARGELPERNKRILDQVPTALRGVSDRLAWFIDFGRAFPYFRSTLEGMGISVRFQGASLPTSSCLETGRPELWFHTFNTLDPGEENERPTIYRRMR